MIWALLVLVVVGRLLAVFVKPLGGLLEARRTSQVLANNAAGLTNEATKLANREREYALERKIATAQETDGLRRAELLRQTAEAQADTSATNQTVPARKAARELAINARAQEAAKLAQQEALTENDARVMRALSRAYRAYSKLGTHTWTTWLGAYSWSGRDPRHVSAQVDAYVASVQKVTHTWRDWIGNH
jgi:hypothetical protein